jgi:hypothetical protein
VPQFLGTLKESYFLVPKPKIKVAALRAATFILGLDLFEISFLLPYKMLALISP